jgi:hypothetical protein
LRRWAVARRARLLAAGAHDELERLLRAIENRDERTRRSGAAGPDLSWLREELGMHGDSLAA